jgi:hypothetical protein
MAENMTDMPPQPANIPPPIGVGPGGAAAVMPVPPTRHRPFVVTILAIGAGILAVLAGIHLLQALGIIPYVIGPLQIRAFSLFYAMMWGLLIWVYVWLIRALWRVDPEAWIFMVVVSMFNMIYDFVLLLGNATWSDVAASFMVSAVVLLFCVLPSTRRAFDRA